MHMTTRNFALDVLFVYILIVAVNQHVTVVLLV